MQFHTQRGLLPVLPALSMELHVDSTWLRRRYKGSPLSALRLAPVVAINRLEAATSSEPEAHKCPTLCVHKSAADGISVIRNPP